MPEEQEYLLKFVLRVRLARERIMEQSKYLKDNVIDAVIPATPRYTLLRAIGEDVLRDLNKIEGRLEEWVSFAQEEVL